MTPTELMEWAWALTFVAGCALGVFSAATTALWLFRTYWRK